MALIYVVEDDKNIQEIETFALANVGYVTLTTYRQLFGTFNETYLKMDSTNFLRRFKHLFQKTGRQVATKTKRAATYTYQIQPI